MVQTSFFWCGNIMLLHHLLSSHTLTSIVIKFIDEIINDRDYTYRVLIDNKEYTYRFALTSDSKCAGSFFIESIDWRSPVYSFSRPYNFIHINETSLDYHDACMFNESCFVDVYICGGRKKSISTMSITNSGNKYTVRYINVPVADRSEFSTNAIRDLFAMTGTVNTIKQIVADVVNYESRNLSLVGYTDHPLQIVGIETAPNGWGKTTTLQAINSFFNQKIEFKERDGLYTVTEYVNSVIKRKYNLRIFDNKIIIPDRELVFSYQVDNGNVIFRKI